MTGYLLDHMHTGLHSTVI